MSTTSNTGPWGLESRGNDRASETCGFRGSQRSRYLARCLPWLALVAAMALWPGTHVAVGQEVGGDEANEQGEARKQLTESVANLDQQPLDPLSRPIPDQGDKESKENGQSILNAIDSKTKRSIAKMVGGLALVVAIFLIWATYFGKKKSAVSGASSAMEVLSRSALTKTQHMQLVRLGNRLLLVAISDQRVDTLAEVTDPQEVEEIEQMLKQGDRSVLQKTRERLARGAGSVSTAVTRSQPVYEA